MGDWNLIQDDGGTVHSVERKATGDSGPDIDSDEVLVMKDGTVPAAVADIPRGFVVDEPPDDNEPQMVNVYGEGCKVEGEDLSLTPEEPVWSNGDGTVTQTKPGASAGDEIVRVGTAYTATIILVDIGLYERGA